eukprot:233650-Chlamydomonas_euryale.AAC.6
MPLAPLPSAGADATGAKASLEGCRAGGAAPRGRLSIPACGGDAKLPTPAPAPACGVPAAGTAGPSPVARGVLAAGRRDMCAAVRDAASLTASATICRHA